ncbi:hypothetical protein VTH06DRAFT_2458 [Thermothelomyces fergusii]
MEEDKVKNTGWLRENWIERDESRGFSWIFYGSCTCQRDDGAIFARKSPGGFRSRTRCKKRRHYLALAVGAWFTYPRTCCVV